MSNARSLRAVIEAAAPPMDSVELWLTPTIEEDYLARNAFPELRINTAALRRNASGWGLQLLSVPEARLVLADIIQRLNEVAGPLMRAYQGYRRRLITAIADAQGRQALFDASKPKCVRRGGRCESWIGTRDQLGTLGIVDFPGQSEHDKRRKLRTRDSRGYTAAVFRGAGLWPGLFEVSIFKPASIAAPVDGVDLSQLPDSPDELRNHLTISICSVGQHVKKQMQSPLGYRYTQEAVDNFHDALMRAYNALKDGAVIGFSRREERHRAAAKGAKADERLQSFLTSVMSAPEGGVE